MKQDLVVKKMRRIVSREVEDKIIILDPQEGNVFTFNNTAAHIWKFLYKKRAITEIVKKISVDFDIPENQIQKDVAAFIQEGIKNKLLKKSV